MNGGKCEQDMAHFFQGHSRCVTYRSVLHTHILARKVISCCARNGPYWFVAEDAGHSEKGLPLLATSTTLTFPRSRSLMSPRRAIFNQVGSSRLSSGAHSLYRVPDELPTDFHSF